MKYFKVMLLSFLSFSSFSISYEMPPQPTPQVTDMPQDSLLDATLNYARGHQTFRDLYFKQFEPEFIRLVREGQNPHTLFIGCSDSRMVPDLILGTRPGDLFVIRTAGNFVPMYEKFEDDGVSATIQYAIQALGIRHIVVCGHSHCGAIKGLFEPLDAQKFDILKRWLRWGEQAKETTLMMAKNAIPKEQIYQVAERISVIYQLEHLMSFPYIRERVIQGSLFLHGWYYQIETGEIEYYDFEAYQFKPLSTALMPKKQF